MTFPVEVPAMGRRRGHDRQQPVEPSFAIVLPILLDQIAIARVRSACPAANGDASKDSRSYRASTPPDQATSGCMASPSRKVGILDASASRPQTCPACL